MTRQWQSGGRIVSESVDRQGQTGELLLSGQVPDVYEPGKNGVFGYPDPDGGWVDPACPVEWGHPLNRGLVGWWLAAPNSGWWGGKHVYDAVRGGKRTNNGSFVASTFWSPSPPGKISPCAGFGGGAGNYITIPANMWLRPSSALTVSAWAMPRSFTAPNQRILGSRDAAGGFTGFLLAWDSGSPGSMRMLIGNGSSYDIALSSVASTVDRWEHFIGTWNGSNIVLYRNGVQVGTSAAASGISYGATPADLQFAKEASGVNTAHMRLTDVRLYNRGLSPAEARELHSQSLRNHPDTMRWVSTRAYSLPPPEPTSGPRQFQVADRYLMEGANRQYQVGGLYVVDTIVEVGGVTIPADVGTYGITGTAANFLRGIVMPSVAGSYSLSGQPVAVKAGRKTSTEVGDYTLSGVDALFSRTYSIGAAIGSYTLSGVVSSLLKTSVLAAAVGSYVLNGTAAALTADKLIVAAVGAYTLNGVDATLTESGGLPVLSAEPGSYTLNGTVASLLADKTVTAAPGSYTLSGQDASFLRGLVVNTDGGAYALNGVDAGLLKSSSFNANIGQYTINGVSANLTATRLLPAEVGNYTLNGVASLLHHDHAIVASPGSYVLNGVDASLIYSGQVYVLDAAVGEYTITGMAVTFSIVRADNHRIVWRCGTVNSIIVDGSNDGNRVVWRGDV